MTTEATTSRSLSRRFALKLGLIAVVHLGLVLTVLLGWDRLHDRAGFDALTLWLALGPIPYLPFLWRALVLRAGDLPQALARKAG